MINNSRHPRWNPVLSHPELCRMEMSTELSDDCNYSLLLSNEQVLTELSVTNVLLDTTSTELSVSLTC